MSLNYFFRVKKCGEANGESSGSFQYLGFLDNTDMVKKSSGGTTEH